MVCVGCIDEEGDSQGARFIKDRYHPDYCIIGEPSGWDGVTIGYKGSIKLRYEQTTEKAHSAMTTAPSALEDAVTFYNDAVGFCNEFSRNIKGEFASLRGTIRSLNSEDDGLTLKVKMELDFRIPPGFDVEELSRFLEGQKREAVVTIYEIEEPVMAQKNTMLVRAFLRSIRNDEGIPRFKKKTGSSDMNLLARYWKFPMVAYGPGESSVDHTPYENLSLDEFEKAVRVLDGTLRDILCSNR